MNQPAQSNVDVTIGPTGYNPYRLSQLASTDLWVKAGMPADLAENYIGAINGALSNLNMASDMKIPGAQKYTGVVLDTRARPLSRRRNHGGRSLAEHRSRLGRNHGRLRPRRADQGAGSGARHGQLTGPMPRTRTTFGQPGLCPGWASAGESWGEWFDRHSRTFFIAPAVVLILIFAIFPTFYSIVFALSRVRFTADGSAVPVRLVPELLRSSSSATNRTISSARSGR